MDWELNAQSMAYLQICEGNGLGRNGIEDLDLWRAVKGVRLALGGEHPSNLLYILQKDKIQRGNGSVGH